MIKIQHNDSNLIEIELIKEKEVDHNSSSDVVKMMLVKNGRKSTLPVIIKRKSKKIYVHSLSGETYFKSIDSRRFLNSSLSKEAQKLISEKKSLLTTLDHMSIEKRQLIRQLIEQQIDEIEEDRKYWGYSLNLRGLLLYLLEESTDSNRIDKTLEALAKRDAYISVKDEFLTHNDQGQEVPREWNYRIKENFPFLSFYNEFKKILPEKFAATTLKRVALEFQSRLDNIGLETLKYEITSRYYHYFFLHFWSPHRLLGLPLPLIKDRTQVDLDLRKKILAYQIEILRYLNHKTEKETVGNKHNLDCYLEFFVSSLLIKEIEDFIDINISCNNMNMISVHEMIQKYTRNMMAFLNGLL